MYGGGSLWVDDVDLCAAVVETVEGGEDWTGRDGWTCWASEAACCE